MEFYAGPADDLSVSFVSEQFQDELPEMRAVSSFGNFASSEGGLVVRQGSGGVDFRIGENYLT